MRFLLGTVAHNQHVQNIAQSLHEAGMLGEYHTGGVDVWHSGWMKRLRSWAGKARPGIEAKLSRRKVKAVPEKLVTADWRWEAGRVAVHQLGFGPVLEDWLWEHSEHALDRYCAGRIAGPEFGAYLGVEFGALRGLRQAKRLGKPAVVAFLSPHHATRARWVDAEYGRFPELLTPSARKLLTLGKTRDARRDEEAWEASIIHCASRFTRDSLMAAGIPAEKIMVVPLGCPAVVEAAEHRFRPMRVRFLASGKASPGKGSHILLEAWRRIRAGSAAELHFFGVNTLPKRCLENLPPNIVFHGPVGSARISEEYAKASALVFPTLCDGYGMVVPEALSHGLPVITTPNAGAAGLIREDQNGWIVPARDADALAARMQWCIENPGGLEEMREPARQTARDWTWADFRKSFLSQLFAQLERVQGRNEASIAYSGDSRS